MKIRSHNPRKYRTVSVPAIGVDVFVFTQLLGRGADLCNTVWQMVVWRKVVYHLTTKEGHSTCPYASTRLQKNLGLITSNCLMFAKK